ncbi:MAG: 30S ribosomal protein S6 [Proteobacteria bacterium]|nr:MAG: 30S ribosomal protein S6 [Pseudomonadota bacterium]
MSKTVLAGYETTFITRPEMTDEQLRALQEKLKEVVGSFKGALVSEDDWGVRKLAYKINKDSRGRYTHYVYTGTGNVVAELERNLRLNEHVLRFLSVNVGDEFNAEEYSKRKDALKAQAKKREEEREARREERAAERRRFESEERGDRDDSSNDSGSSEE